MSVGSSIYVLFPVGRGEAGGSSGGGGDKEEELLWKMAGWSVLPNYKSAGKETKERDDSATLRAKRKPSCFLTLEKEPRPPPPKKKKSVRKRVGEKNKLVSFEEGIKVILVVFALHFILVCFFFTFHL